MNKPHLSFRPMKITRPALPGDSAARLRRKNLVIVRAGRNSLHAGWTAGTGEAEFDLLVAAYEKLTPGASDQWSILLPGRKIAGYNELFQRYPELLDRYEYIALIDDDIKVTKQDFNRLFQIGADYSLDLFQPALSWDSHFSYAATLAIHKFRLRFTNTVEMMCPVFRAKYLRIALPLFSLGYETGIDLVWTRLNDDPWFRYAIVDEVVVTHTRVIGTTMKQQGFAPNEPYDRQVECVLKRFAAEFRGFVTYAGIDKHDRLVSSRYLIGLHSLATWTAWRRTPVPLTYFVRLVTDYTRHCFVRPTNLHRIPMAENAPRSSAIRTGS